MKTALTLQAKHASERLALRARHASERRALLERQSAERLAPGATPVSYRLIDPTALREAILRSSDTLGYHARFVGLRPEALSRAFAGVPVGPTIARRLAHLARLFNVPGVAPPLPENLEKPS